MLEKLLILFERMLNAGNGGEGKVVPDGTEFEFKDKRGNVVPFTFRVGTAGTVVVDYLHGDKNVSLLNCANGSYHPNPVIKIRSTTAATGIVAYKV